MRNIRTLCVFITGFLTSIIFLIPLFNLASVVFTFCFSFLATLTYVFGFFFEKPRKATIIDTFFMLFWVLVTGVYLGAVMRLV